MSDDAGETAHTEPARTEPARIEPIVLSHYQAVEMLAALDSGAATVQSSLDLNRTRITLPCAQDGVLLPDGAVCERALLAHVADAENSCYVVEGNELIKDELIKIETFSEAMGRYYSLYPTSNAPTMLISGIPMHRIQDTDPWRDTQAKIRAAAPVRGDVLDTCTGLGYTALLAARTAAHVTTVELDPAAHEVVRQNPWSRGLFDSPNITTRIGDSAELIGEFADGSFDCIIHDPPMFSLAGELYALDFYRHALRLLRRRGRLFHYIGNPESKSGATVTRGVIRRLKEAGFQRVITKPDAFGVTATT